jgi:hypothetical protein
MAEHLSNRFCDLEEFLAFEFECVIIMCQDLCANFFNRVKLLREVIKAPHIFSVGRTISTLRGFTTFAYSTLAETNDFEQLTSLLRHMQALNPPQSMCPIFIPLVVRVTSWIIIFNQGEEKSKNWEPWARMGIYVGCSSSHASNVSMILNPRMGRISLQFQIVYDNDFTTVQYLRTATVPPHWAAIVQASAFVELYT